MESHALDVIIGGHGRDIADGPAAGNSFNGALDDVRIYDNVLSAAEISAARASGIPEPSTFGLLGLIRRRRWSKNLLF